MPKQTTTKKMFTAELRRQVGTSSHRRSKGQSTESGNQNQIDDIAANLSAQHNDILEAISDLRKDLGAAASVSDTVVDEFRREIKEASELKNQLTELSDAIDQTKREIVALRPLNDQDDRLLAVSNELDQVVATMEHATEAIIEAAEAIDDQAGSMRAQASDDAERARAEDLSELVVKIFEACNFQDLTGQRITKVVNTLKFIEDRVNKMMEIWGGEEGFVAVDAVVEVAEEDSDARLLNGPQNEATKIDQSQIDALFD